MSSLKTLRAWQRQFHLYVGNSPNGVNAAIVTGAGKTFGTLITCQNILFPKYKSPLLIVLVPKKNIGDGWIKEARISTKLKLVQGLDPKTFMPSRHDGVVMTYQSMLSQKHIIASLCVNHDVIIVRDEAQWLGENSWGDIFTNATENAVYHIGLTGTPFRTIEDDELIGFKYVKGNAVADFNYSYTEARKDAIVPEIRWTSLGGMIEWTEPNKQTHQAEWNGSRFGEDEQKGDDGRYLQEPLINKRLRYATYADKEFISPFLEELISASQQQLDNIRQAHANAGGIIFAQNIEAAEAIAVYLRNKGQTAMVVHGEQKDAQDKIKAYRKSSIEWLVSVDLIKEGTDIPRLRVAMLASQVTTPRQVLQMTGRLLRLDTHLGQQHCHVFCAADPRLIQIMEHYGVGIPLKKPAKGRTRSSPSGEPVYRIPVQIQAGDINVELDGTLGVSSKDIKQQAQRWQSCYDESGFNIQFGDLPVSTLLDVEQLIERIQLYTFSSMRNHIKTRDDLAVELHSITNLEFTKCALFVDLLMRANNEQTKARTKALQPGAATPMFAVV